MAKKAMVERELKRQKLVDKYAAKRAELKEFQNLVYVYTLKQMNCQEY